MKCHISASVLKSSLPRALIDHREAVVEGRCYYLKNYYLDNWLFLWVVELKGTFFFSFHFLFIQRILNKNVSVSTKC